MGRLVYATVAHVEHDRSQRGVQRCPPPKIVHPSRVLFKVNFNAALSKPMRIRGTAFEKLRALSNVEIVWRVLRCQDFVAVRLNDVLFGAMI